jgi:Ca2+/Na+ antiporter
MEILSVQHNTRARFRKILGIITILISIVYIVLIFYEPRPINIILAIFWLIMGSLYYVSSFESNRSIIEPGDGFIKIRWVNWFRSKIIQDSEIERIIISRPEIRINIKDKRPLKLLIDFLEPGQKKEIYSYFIALSEHKSYPLEKTGVGLE